jgi:hypothetical protein
MIKLLSLIFIPVFLAGGQATAGKIIPFPINDTAEVVSVAVYPLDPLIEADSHAQYLNFDLVLRNRTGHILQLSMIQLSILDGKGGLVQRNYLNQNGQSPSIALLGNTIIQPGESINIFNPFYQFVRTIDISRLRYEFFFDIADTDAEMTYNKTRLPMDFDRSEIKEIRPRLYMPKTNLYLPLKGKLIVWDGHDFYSHHRRFPIGLPWLQEKGIIANSNRYAYDFVVIDTLGEMYNNDPFQKENWYVFGKPVYAPGSGKVVELQNYIPDNAYSGKTVKYPTIPADMDPLGMGNYVMIDHGNGEYSVILHMEKGSVRVKVNELVTAGQQIGTVGFSGDAIFPHVHYTVMNGPKEQVCEGIPSYFNKYKLFSGRRFIPFKKGRIDSGFIIESTVR